MKDELPIPARPAGEITNMSVCMGVSYQDQVWVDLSSASVVSTNIKTAWDLAFESSPDGWRIMLNGSKGMYSWNTGDVPMDQPTDTTGMFAGKKIDASSGNPDSTAIGDWRSTNNVYIVDLGFNTFGAAIGLRKVRPLSSTATTFTVEIASIAGSNVNTVFITKDPTRSFTHYSFSNGTVQIGPPRGEWDIVFTQYTYQFHEPFIAYIVTGVLSDRSSVRVSRIIGKEFSEVLISDTLQFPFSSARDAIGYDWKEYSFDTSSYTVLPQRSYIIQDADGLYYKLRFIDFYGDQGQVGCPRFELEAI
jgi:hypothetical protein